MNALKFSFVLTALAAAVQGQPAMMPSGIQVVKSEYNDLNTRVNVDAEKVFGNPAGGGALAADLLAALDQLAPKVEEAMKHPGAEVQNPQYKQFLESDGAAAQEIRRLHAQRLQLFGLYRLALDEPKAVRAIDAALAKGGREAAQASLNRAAAHWLMAGHKPLDQLTAFEQVRDANNAAAQKLPWQTWSDLLQFNPLSSPEVGVPMLAYVKPFFNNAQAVRMLNIWTIPVKQMELEGKPLVIQGTLISGTHFSTAAWQRRVVLVAGWSPDFAQCAKILGDEQRLLEAHRSEGLEVLGVAYGPPAAEKAFLAQHPEITFPNISDRSHPDIANVCSGMTTFGLAGETLGPGRLIGRDGILHYVEDKNKLETQIIKLLAEVPPSLTEAKEAR